MNQTLIVSNEFNNVRLDVYLTEVLDDWTRSQIKKQIDNKGAFINNKQAKAGNIVKEKDEISISFNKESGLEDVNPENIPLNVVYEDNDMIVINKPQGMVVHPAPGNYEHTLVNALLYYLREDISTMSDIRPGIVHRIDKDTSGLLVVAKNNFSHVKLADQFFTHESRRTYVALLEGNLKTDEGRIETFLNRDPKDRKKYTVADFGKVAITNYKVLERFDGYTLCEFKLETGRTHQIRVHAKYLGHPIVGDKLYGGEEKSIKANGQLLFAYKIKFVHPSTKQAMCFQVDLPDYFEEVIKKIS